MSDLNWCTYCDSAVNSFSDSLYCSEACLRQDALDHHPLLGYDWGDLKNFPRSTIPPASCPRTPPASLYQSPFLDSSSVSTSPSFTAPNTPSPLTRFSDNMHLFPRSGNTKFHLAS
ncbi:hypothetical protein BX666DRAFT_1971214 [Dichotomocladium elegans]|nr:hypothetical protein BX666DRAFT_1971214 [Dichotomocladium elegans]